MRSKLIKYVLKVDPQHESQSLWATQASQDKRLAELENRIRSIELESNLVSKELVETRHTLAGLLDYLDVTLEKEWVDDPQWPKPRPRQMEVIKVKKKKN